ncbi:unnamed protein product [Aphanomyces euteiches]|uniref:Uncharacterized protein n=1 Tax=Aphanomyces euteiches TaxID=100861 RepID=A0A6G0W787_9STRA|nr:hypothetical protein Ae201684_018269 [Aphanomyces euteiches]KAH9069174.1 hypothetical protein Ae201684P_004864 [Aphanomyces euteiches]KAH9143193.1 hypothetical protein AeRB84_012797 [Aphanomyces euteiches]
MAIATDYSGWVKDLESFKPSVDNFDDDEEDRLRDMSAGKTSKKGHASQLEEIKQEMKLLNWHKLANEAALKAALIKTKKLKREDARQSSLLDAEERMERLQQIEEEENMKPLEVTAEFIRKYEDEERREERRLEADVARHINCLRKLKVMLETREDQRRRYAQYREGKQRLDKGLSPSLNQEEHEETPRNDRLSSSRSTGNSTNDVSRVLSSLDKLVELERRISCLEQDDVEPATTATIAPVIKTAKETLKFTKTSTGRNTALRVTKAPATKAKSQTFLTGVPEWKVKTKRAVPSGTNGDKSKEARRAAELRRMPERDRQKAMRMDKKQAREVKAQQQSVKIDQWAAKKKQAAVTRKVNYVKANMTNQTPLATKKKTTNNRHMAEFESMKRNFEAKKAASKTQPPTRLPPVAVKKRLPSNAQPVQPWAQKPKPKPPAEQRVLPMIHGRVKQAAPAARKPGGASTHLPKVTRPTNDEMGLGIRGFRSG